MVASVEVSPPKKSLNVVASLNLGSKTPDGSLRRNVNLTTEPDPALRAPRAFAPASVASLESDAERQPQLVAQPKPVDRSSHFTPPSQADRGKLDALVTAAASMPMPSLVQGRSPAVRPQKALAAAALAEGGPPAAVPNARVASLDPSAGTVTDMHPASLGNGWAEAPAFDEDHPDELDYRPFPLAPFLTDNPTARDQPLAEMQAPDVAATLRSSGRRRRHRADEVQARNSNWRSPTWSDHFQGKAVHARSSDGTRQRPHGRRDSEPFGSDERPLTPQMASCTVASPALQRHLPCGCDEFP